MRLDEIPKDRSWRRRVVTLPAWFLLATVLPVLLPAALCVTVVVDLLRRRDLSLSRTMVFFTWYFVLECAGLIVAFGLWARRLLGMSAEDYEMKNRRVQQWWARGLFFGTARIFSMEVALRGLEELEDGRPAVVLARHASTLDTMLPIAVVREMKLYRYVIKAELLIAPALDFVAQRFPNVFVVRGAENGEREVQKVLALSQEMGEGSALVIYPEGTRFSEKKRARLLEKFQEKDPAMYELTESLRHTLPPLREGVMRLLQETTTDVVFIAHRGLEEATSMAELAGGGMTKAKLQAEIWRVPGAKVPRDPEGVRAFLVENWRRIDGFVAQGVVREVAQEG